MDRPEMNSERSRRPSPTPLYWDHYARRAKKAMFQERIALHKRDLHLKLIQKWAPGLEGKYLLKTDAYEEAFGRDAFLDALSETAALAVGMDISSEIAGRAKRRFPSLSYTATDIKNLPFRSAVFDVIISNSTLDQLVPNDVSTAVGELARILKPGGTMILTLDNRHNPLHVFSHWIRRVFGWFYTDRCYSVPEAGNLLRENGFRVLETTAVFHVPFPLNFLAKTAERLFGRAVVPWIERMVRFYGRFEKYPTRFLTGRHIALLARKIPGNGPSQTRPEGNPG
jgi:ubiquinone/menaquinone biosynthesis C-methylase UbiE